LNQPEEAIQAVSRAAAIANQQLQESPGDQTLLVSAANAFETVSIIQQGTYHAEDAFQSIQKSTTLFEQAAASNPSPRVAHSLALALSRLAMAYRSLAELNPAEETLRRSVEIEQKGGNNPASSASLAFLAVGEENLGTVKYSERYPSQGDLDSSILHFKNALDVYAKLTAADPNDLSRKVTAAEVTANLALDHLRRNRPGDMQMAAELSARSASDMEAARKRSPSSGLLVSRYPAAIAIRGLVLATQGHAEEARQKSEDALAVRRQTLAKSKNSVDNRIDLTGQLLRHAEVLTICGQSANAHAAIEEAEGILKGLDQELRVHQSMSYQAAEYFFALARTQQAAGKNLAEAARSYDEAIQLWSPWQTGKQHIQQRIAEATEARDRCRRAVSR
jgi:tetratricopeptide (TPR) repeat protein